jgi:hypothetical protein
MQWHSPLNDVGVSDRKNESGSIDIQILGLGPRDRLDALHKADRVGQAIRDVCRNLPSQLGC